MADIHSLSQILPILGSVVENPTTSDWMRFEEQHSRLPSDYKNFLSVFGSGLINDFIRIYNPFANGKANDWLLCSAAARNAILALRHDSPGEYLDWSVFPEPSGLLAIGSTIDGDDLYWTTKGEPDQWTVVVSPSRSPELHHYGDILIDFIYHLLKVPRYCHSFVLPHRKKSFFTAVSFDRPPDG